MKCLSSFDGNVVGQGDFISSICGFHQGVKIGLLNSIQGCAVEIHKYQHTDTNTNTNTNTVITSCKSFVIMIWKSVVLMLHKSSFKARQVI